MSPKCNLLNCLRMRFRTFHAILYVLYVLCIMRHSHSTVCPLDIVLDILHCIPSDHPSKDVTGHHNVYIPPIRRKTRWVATLFTLCPSVDATFGHSHSVSPAELAWWTPTLSTYRSSFWRPVHPNSTFTLSGRTACATIIHSRCCRSRQRYHYILVDLYVVPSTVPAVGKPLQR